MFDLRTTDANENQVGRKINTDVFDKMFEN